MLTKIYTAVWSIVAIAGLFLLLSGNLTSLAEVALGFVVFGLVFAGMMVVLPHEVGHPKQNNMKPESQRAIKIKTRQLIENARELTADLISSDGVEIGKPHYR